MRAGGKVTSDRLVGIGGLVADWYDESAQPLGARAKVGLGALAVLALGALVAAPELFFPADSPQIVTADLQTVPSTSPEESTDVPVSSPTPAPTPSQALTTSTDAVTGVTVEHPAGWTVTSESSAMVLRSDECGSSTVVFYPITLIDRELQAEAILTSYLDAVAQALKANRGTLERGSIRRASDSEASVLVAGTACGNAMRGQAGVIMTGSRALVKLAWTPTTLADSLQTTITTMLQRYQTTETGTFLTIGGSRLELAAPTDWTKTEQAQSMAALKDSLKVQTTVLPKTSDVALDGLVDTWLQLERDAGTELNDVTTVSTGTAKDVTDTRDRPWSLAYRVLTYTQGGTPMRALVTAGQTPELGDAALLTWRQAPTETWETETSLLLAIEQSVRLLPKSGLITGEAGPFQLPRSFLDEHPSPLLGSAYADAVRTTRGNRWTELIQSYARLRSPSEGTVYLGPKTAERLDTGTYRYPNASGTAEVLESVVE